MLPTCQDSEGVGFSLVTCRRDGNVHVVYHVYGFDFGFGEYNYVVGIYSVVHWLFVFGTVYVVDSDV